MLRSSSKLGPRSAGGKMGGWEDVRVEARGEEGEGNGIDRCC